jgi:hypothetical protein
MKKRMGRPRVGTLSAKAIFISARFTPVEARQIESAIVKSGMRKSDFVRKSLISSAETLNFE